MSYRRWTKHIVGIIVDIENRQTGTAGHTDQSGYRLPADRVRLFDTVVFGRRRYRRGAFERKIHFDRFSYKRYRNRVLLYRCYG